MRKKKIEIFIDEYESIEELSIIQKDLFQSAHQAALNAYSPYSNFKVGCALYLQDVGIITGSNQENMAYPSGLCAERVALFSAGALHPMNKIISIAIVCSNGDSNLSDIFSPCGACRQVMLEYESKQKEDIEILIEQPNKKIIKFLSVKSLLPFSFNVSSLHSQG